MADTGETPADVYFDAGAAAWPGVSLDRIFFARHLASLAAAPPLDRAADVYIACACAVGAKGAFESFERQYVADLRRAAARIDGSAAFIDDVVQAVLERLLVPAEGGPPRIADYAARGPLRSWLAATAVRVAINAKKGKANRPNDELTSKVMPANQGSAEINHVRARYKVALEEALRAALGRISAKDRALLRLHFVEGMTVDALAASYGVSRSVAGRWLVAAREALSQETKTTFCDRAGVTDSEYASVAAQLKGDLDVSIRAELLRA